MAQHKGRGMLFCPEFAIFVLISGGKKRCQPFNVFAYIRTTNTWRFFKLFIAIMNIANVILVLDLIQRLNMETHSVSFYPNIIASK